MVKRSPICQAPDCSNPKDTKQRSSLCVMHRVRRSRHKSFDLPVKPPLPEGIAYICATHGEIPFDKSYKNPKDGYYSCVQCRRNNDKKFDLNNPEKKKGYKNFHYVGKQKIRVSVQDYNSLMITQNGCCAICKKPETAKNTVPHAKNKTKKLAIDHCHDSLKIRGLLCHNCNNMIGFAKDSVESLKSAIQYLESHV